MDKICRAYILPRLSDDSKGPMYVEVIDSAQAKAMLDKLKEVVKRAIEDYLNSLGKEKIKTVEELYDVLNEIVVTLRWPLFLDPIPGIVPSLTVLIKLFLRKPSYIDTDLDKLLTDEAELYKAIIDYNYEEIKKLQEDLFSILQYPADTRPAANTSSLLIHMLVTSAIATCIFESKNPRSSPDWLKQITMLRLLSLFHDVGKFNIEEWHRHEELFSELIKELFDRYVEGEAKEVVMSVADMLVSKKEESLVKIFRQADAIASNVDRISEYFFEMLSSEEHEELKKHSLGKPLKGAYRTWKFWERVGFEKIKDLSEKFAKRASRITKDNPILRGEGSDIIAEDVLLLRLDIRGIQKYIAIRDLRSMCGASRIVDLVSTVIIPAYLVIKMRLPAENVLYLGGGNVTFIAPRLIGEEEAAEGVEIAGRVKVELGEKLSKLGIGLTLGSSPLYTSLAYTNYCIDSEIAKQKLLEIPNKEASPNVMYVCDFCEEGYAEMEVEDRLVCKSCYIKRFFGNLAHFRWKLSRLRKILEVGAPEDDVLENIMEYIAGITYSALKERSYKEYPYIALIRIDGNLTSQIMAATVSITDAVERSIRIDHALKKALHEFLEVLKNVSREDYIRLVLGVVYIGGDDGFLLTPSYLAIPLAIHVAREYYRNMGFKSTISLGIAVAKPKHPIWELYRAAGHLLDSYAKPSTRKHTIELHESEARASYDFCGGIALYLADSGTMTIESLDAAIWSLSREGLTLMSRERRLGIGDEGGYRISPPSDPRSFLRLLSIIFSDVNLDNFDVVGLLSEIISSAEESRRGKIDEFKGFLRDLRNDALDILYKSLLEDDSIEIKMVHAARESHRLASPIKKHYHWKILTKLLDPEREAFPVYDLIQVIKSLDGDIKEMSK